MTGIEPALSAWEAPSVCVGAYSRIAYGATDLAISGRSGAPAAVEILVENALSHKPVASHGAGCPPVRVVDVDCGQGRSQPLLDGRPASAFPHGLRSTTVNCPQSPTPRGQHPALPVVQWTDRVTAPRYRDGR